MLGVAQGDRHAFERLARRYEKRLYNYVRRLIDDPSEAEDLVQETLIRVYQHAKRFKQDGHFRPWVYRIATNLCRDQQRYRRRRKLVSLDEQDSGIDKGATTAGRLASQAPNPREEAAAHELAGRLQEALTALPMKHRTVFLMARYEGLSYEEIAETLHIPIGTVKSRMNKSVKILLRAVEHCP